MGTKSKVDDFFIVDDDADASVSQTVPDVAPGLTPVSVGDIVLFRISSDDEVRALRPVLVVRVVSPDCLSGSLFLDPDIDWSFEWVKQNLFVQLNEANRIVPIRGTWFGEGMGQWLPK